MLAVISGADSLLVAKKTKEYLQTKNIFESVTYVENPSLETMKEYIFAQDLFGNKSVYIFRELNEDVYDFLFSNIDLFTQSQNIFIAEVSKVLKKQKDICAKARVEIFEVKTPKEREASSFVLADAFLRKDKKAAFVALHDELATKPPEEVHGGLWYQVKNMNLIAQGVSEADSGLHPFVYKKIKQAHKLFSQEEIGGMTTELVKMYHEAHRGETDFSIALEQFVLKSIK